ncbi:MAG: T9SS type A sorting domain-containing protein, partial [Bacteroidales bacterium]|nr:T9SS type A sorting domain-containing protein [Bacteroidales bacterium]
NERTGVDVVGLVSNDLVMMGYESRRDGSSSDVFLMKRDANGGVVSTPEFTTDKSVQIYPNPANDRVYIKSANDLNVEVDFINSVGQLVMKTTLSNQYVSVEALPKGYYLAVIKVDGEKVKQEKLIIQ